MQAISRELIEKEKLERSEAYKYGENRSDYEFRNALVEVLRKRECPNKVNEILHEELLNQILDRNLRIDISAHVNKIFQLFAETIHEIQEALNRTVWKIPKDIYGIKTALENFVYALDDLTNLYKIKMGCTILPSEILSHNDERPLFTHEDLKERYQEGFEVGYRKGLEVQKHKDINERMASLDLT